MSSARSAIATEALAWLTDCMWADMDPEDFDDLTPSQIMRGVERHYEGGWSAFVEASA